MAKIHQNAEKFPIEWDGTVVGGENQGDSLPSSKSIVWGSNPFTWGDVSFIEEIVDGIGTGSRRAREARLQKLDKDKKKRLIRLICRIKGEKVYDEKKEVSGVSMNIKLEDVDLVINEVLGKIKVEKADVI